MSKLEFIGVRIKDVTPAFMHLGVKLAVSSAASTKRHICEQCLAVCVGRLRGAGGGPWYFCCLRCISFLDIMITNVSFVCGRKEVDDNWMTCQVVSYSLGQSVRSVLCVEEEAGSEKERAWPKVTQPSLEAARPGFSLAAHGA